MAEQARLGDKAESKADAHWCPACPHQTVGPAIVGSPDVLVNNLPALRLGDTGVHAACCGPNMWAAADGSGSVFINYRPAVRKGDTTQHCGGTGKMIDGSPDVMVGD